MSEAVLQSPSLIDAPPDPERDQLLAAGQENDADALARVAVVVAEAQLVTERLALATAVPVTTQ
jgi:hypothetical protein